MLEKKSTKIIFSYLVALLLALIFLKVFKEFYIWQFNPSKFNSIFSLWDNNSEINFSGFIYAFIFFLPLLVFVLLKRKFLVWLIGIFIPFLLIIAGGSKEILWFVVLTIIGGLIGWLINLAVKKLKK